MAIKGEVPGRARSWPARRDCGSGRPLSLGGSLDLIPNSVSLAELALDKQAQTLLLPAASRRQLEDLPDDAWTRLKIEFYKDAADAVLKCLME